MVMSIIEENGGRRYGVVTRVAAQLGVGSEWLRNWVARAKIDGGRRPGLASDERARLKALGKENRELRRSNEIWCAAPPDFAVAARIVGNCIWCAGLVRGINHEFLDCHPAACGFASESRRQQSNGESRLGAELDASELVKEVKIKLNILDRTNYRFDSKRKVLQETAETVAID